MRCHQSRVERGSLFLHTGGIHVFLGEGKVGLGRVFRQGESIHSFVDGDEGLAISELDMVFNLKALLDVLLVDVHVHYFVHR